MGSNWTPISWMMPAQEDAGLQLLYVIAILILTAGGAIIEKIKQKQGEAERGRRGRTPRPARSPAPPPVEAEGEFRFPPVIPPVEPPVARPPLPRRPPREPRPERPRRRPRPVVEAPARRERRIRREALAPAPSSVPTITGEAIGEFERQISGVSEGRADALQSALSLEELRAREQSRSPAAVDAAAFRRPTVAELRRAIVLSEILAPPVGLREE